MDGSTLARVYCALNYVKVRQLMRISPLFKQFGSKWSSAKHLPSPKYVVICEPYAGGAGYSLNHVEHDVVLAETDKNIHALWLFLLSCTETEVRDLPINLPDGMDIRSLGLSTGGALLIKHWQRTNNFGDCWTTSPWGNKPGQWTANTRARVAEQSQAIKHWKVVDCAGSLFREKADDACTWHIDPPYQYNYQYKQPPIDYQQLSATIRSLHGQVMVCEAREPKTGTAPSWLPFRDHVSSVTSRRKPTESHHSRELIYTADQG